MSDLDDFFAKRLDEEASFPNRGKHWKQMSKRLDAFDSGAVQGNPRGLRMWQAVTLVAVATTVFLLWKTLATQRANKVLHQEVASLQSEQSNLTNQLISAEKRAVDSAAEFAPKKVPTSDANAEILPLTKVKIAEMPTGAKTSSVAANASKPTRLVDASTTKPHAEIGNSLPENKGVPAVFEEKIPAPEEIVVNKNETIPSDSTAAQVSELVAHKSILDSLKSALAQSDSLLVVASKSKDTIASAPSIAQEIKPQPSSKKRFRIGAQATVGFVQPKQKGVSALRGQGLSIEASVFRGLWVTGSVDWLHHEVSTDEFVAKFHPHHDSLPNPPNHGGGGPGGSHPKKLVQVESSPRQQNYGFGLRYELPVTFWLRPSIRVAHEWVRVSPTLVTYKFEDDHHGWPGPQPDPEHEYTAEMFDAQWHSNHWRFGVGLEKNLPNWTFGLWADYSKDFSEATPSFDALYLRGGAQYRF